MRESRFYRDIAKYRRENEDSLEKYRVRSSRGSRQSLLDEIKQYKQENAHLLSKIKSEHYGHGYGHDTSGMTRNDSNSIIGAMNGFSRFHDREAGKPVYPFEKNETGIFQLPEFVTWPDEVGRLGEAMRTLYESDKWSKKISKTTQYYHDHDKGLITFYVPMEHEHGIEACDLPFEWPDEVMLIGKCIGFVVKPDSTGQITEGLMEGNNVLVASPDGWVDPKHPNRVFLAIINLDGGGVEAIIHGGKLRITAHGIEG